MLCALGLPPMHHVDDSVRATVAALDLVANIKVCVTKYIYIYIDVMISCGETGRFLVVRRVVYYI